MLATCKDIFPPRTANTGGSERASRSPERSPSSPNVNLGASRKAQDHFTLLFCGRMLKCAGDLTYLAVLSLDLLVQVSSDYEFTLRIKFLNVHFSCNPAVTLSCSFLGPIFSSLPFLSLPLSENATVNVYCTLVNSSMVVTGKICESERQKHLFTICRRDPRCVE